MLNTEGQQRGNVWRPSRLRTRLAVALAALFIPLSALVILTHFETRDDQRRARVEAIEALNDTIAAVVDGFSKDLESFTLSIAITTADATRGDTSLIQQQAFGPYFDHLMQSYGLLRALFITDLSGKVIASQSPPSTGVDLSARPYIQALQGGAPTTWSGALTGLESGQTIVTFGRRLVNAEGQPFAYLMAAFYADKLAERLPGELPADANVSLIDQNGLLLFTSKEDGPRPGSDLAQSPVLESARRDGETVIQDGETPVDGGDRYGAFARLSETGWIVGLTRPASAVDGPLESRFRRDLLIIAVLLLGSFIATLLIASRLSKPLATLAGAAASIAKGERPVMPIAAADAEVHELATAMSLMSRAVEEREDRLRAQARILETLEGVGQAVATELDYRKAVATVSQAGFDLTEAEGACLLLRKQGNAEWDLESPSFAGACDTAPFVADDVLLQQVSARRIVSIADVIADPEVASERAFSAEPRRIVRTFLGVPIVGRRGDMLGGLFLFHSQPDRLPEYERRLAIGLARRAGVLLDNARLYSEAQEVQEQLRAMNQAKTEFIGVMSHELRTPITTIYGGARLLHNRRKSLPEESTDEMIASIEEEAERLYRLVEDLLALARSELGDEINTAPLQLARVVDRVVKQFATYRPARPIEVRIAPSATVVQAETTYLFQVLHNLVTNADKYSDSGLPIEIEAQGEGNEVIVRVLDRGPGVDESEIDQIFDSFYRSERTAKRASGKGLGLTVCRRLIEAMSGHIWAAPRAGGGLEVAFSLPAGVQEPAALETASERR
jgi:signal transduction histidine kinase